MNQPCVRSCAERSPTCHAECEKYKAYVEQQKKSYVQRLREYEVGSTMHDAFYRMTKGRRLKR